MKRTGQLTVLVVGQHGERVRRVKLPRPLLLQAGAALASLALLLLLGLGHYLSLLPESSENRALRAENAELRSLVVAVKDQVSTMGATMERVERYDLKLRSAVARNSPPTRALAIGPVSGPHAPVDEGPPAGRENLQALPGRIATLVHEASLQEQSLRELQEYFDDRQSLLASTPSIWPTHGWVTSDFGVRLDPFTAERRMHEGLDIGTSVGQPVVAPSDGTVVLKGWEGGYGNVLVIDHGYGVRTRYGHLSRIFVSLGERVKRGMTIAAVGDTGRSTGPHLHYEVRIDGIPENPRKFILE